MKLSGRTIVRKSQKLHEKAIFLLLQEEAATSLSLQKLYSWTLCNSPEYGSAKRIHLELSLPLLFHSISIIRIIDQRESCSSPMIVNKFRLKFSDHLLIHPHPPHLHRKVRANYFSTRYWFVSQDKLTSVPRILHQSLISECF